MLSCGIHHQQPTKVLVFLMFGLNQRLVLEHGQHGSDLTNLKSSNWVCFTPSQIIRAEGITALSMAIFAFSSLKMARDPVLRNLRPNEHGKHRLHSMLGLPNTLLGLRSIQQLC